MGSPRVTAAAGIDDVGGLLQAVIRASGTTQKSLAATLGMSEKHLSQLLNDRARMTTGHMQQIAALCGYELTITATSPDGGEVPC